MNTNWQTKKLGDICEMISRGISPKYTNTQGLCVLNQKCIRNHIINFDISRLHDFKNKKISSDKLIQIGDVLVNSTGTGTLGRVAQVKELPFEATVDSHITIVRPIKNMFYNEFFGYALIFIEEEISKKGDGCGGQTELARTTLKNDFAITYPESLAEQQRIVTILGNAFAVIEKAKSNAEQNLKNAKELFESYLQDMLENKDQRWEKMTLGKLVDNIITGPFGSALHKSDYVEDGIPVVNPQNIIDGQIVSLQKTMVNEATFNRLEKYALKYGDIVIARRGEMGRCAITKNNNVGWLCGTGSFVIRVNKKKADSKFLNIVLSSAEVKKQLEKSSIGATMSNLNQSILSELLLNTPPVIEQQNIVKKFNAITVETKKLESIYQYKINELEELKKSILQKAFSGKLNNINIDINTKVHA